MQTTLYVQEHKRLVCVSSEICLIVIHILNARLTNSVLSTARGMITVFLKKKNKRV